MERRKGKRNESWREWLPKDWGRQISNQLGDLTPVQIAYIMSPRCKNYEKKARVLKAMRQLADRKKSAADKIAELQA